MFRRFELTISVFLHEDAPLPESFRDWIHVAGLDYDGASPTTLERVVETRQPPAPDVVERRGEEFERGRRTGGRRLYG